MTRLAAALLLLALGCPPAQAETLPDYVKDRLGAWLVVTDDGKSGCRIKLERGRTIGGYVASPAPDCAAKNPRLAEVASWDFEGGVRLRDAARKLLFDFQEDETTLMKTSWQSPPVAMIVQAKPGVERAPFAPDLVGTWALKRPGGATLCEVSLARTQPKRNDGKEQRSLKPGTPCDPAIARLKLDTWAVEDFSLMLYGANESSLRFEPSAEGFDKAEGGKPLSLTRVR